MSCAGRCRRKACGARTWTLTRSPSSNGGSRRRERRGPPRPGGGGGGGGGAAGLHEPEAMVVSSVGNDGVPSSRYVLLKGIDHGFVFFTNQQSEKGRELDARPAAAICFPWHVLSRQLRVKGRVERVSDAEND